MILIIAEMAMDGALSGEEETRDNIKSISRKVGDGKAAEIEKERDGGDVVIDKKIARQIMRFAVVEGNLWADELEQRIKDVYTAVTEEEKPPPRKAVLARVTAAILSDLEPTKKKVQFAETPPAPRVEAPSKAAHRKRQAGSRWKREVGVIKRRRAQGASDDVMKDEAITRMRTGWNRWYNNRVVARTQENPEVVYLQFTLGRAANHTEICLTREGWIMSKKDPRWADNTPPLHFNCRSTLVPITKGAAKKWGIRRYTPPGVKDDDVAPEPGFAGEPK